MKSRIFLLGIALAGMLSAPMFTSAQTPGNPNGSNPGLVMSASSSISDLPQTALKFLNRHFRNVNVSKVEREFSPNGYDVKLANGFDVEFDTQGKVLEIDAPSGMTISPTLLREVMTAKAYDNLRRQGKTNNVESIDMKYNGGKLVKVETTQQQPLEIVFDQIGNIVLIEVDD